MQKAWQIYNNVYWGTYAAGIAEFGTGNVVADPKFRGNIDLVADIPTQLDKLISTGTRAGADILPPLRNPRRGKGGDNERSRFGYPPDQRDFSAARSLG